MQPFLLVAMLLGVTALLAWGAEKNNNGLVSVRSKYSVPETLDRLESVVEKQGLTVFARINFRADAEKAGLKMQPSQLLIFGNPKAGTPLMMASPTVAIDFPLKALAWEDSDGKVWLTYNEPEYLKERHSLPEQLMKNISGIGDLVKKAVE
jgi:uncharacterized protein (DUF302 family)